MQPTKNITNAIREAYLKTAMSQKTQNPYSYIELVFVNDFTMRVYPTNEQKFIIAQLSATSTTIPVKTDEDDLDLDLIT